MRYIRFHSEKREKKNPAGLGRKTESLLASAENRGRTRAKSGGGSRTEKKGRTTLKDAGKGKGNQEARAVRGLDPFSPEDEKRGKESLPEA